MGQEKAVARKDEEAAEEARELAEQNPSKENEEAADKAEEKALLVEEKAAKLKAEADAAMGKEAALKRAVVTTGGSGSTGVETPIVKLLKAMSKASTGPSANLADKFLKQEEKATGISGASGVGTGITEVRLGWKAKLGRQVWRWIRR